jgi:RNA polymerase sigma factor (sigma-70 family)
MLETNEIITMCQRLARKYNAPQHYQDLVQEGILVCYEILGKEDCTHPAKLYREANRRMHDFLNLDVLPVSVPAHNITRRLTRDADDTEIGEMSDTGVSWLKTVLQSDWVGYDEDYIESDLDTADAYEQKEYRKYMISVAKKTLSKTEWQIIKMRYFRDLAQEEVANALKSNKMWVSRHERIALDKLKSSLL